MTKISKAIQVLHAGLALGLLVAASSVAAGDLPPRLWRAERVGASGKTTIYLLAITHIGSTAEQDAYFRRRVVPAYMTADVLELEKAQLVAEQVPPCATQLDGPGAREALEDLKDLARFGSEQRLLRTFRLLPQFRNLTDPEAAAKRDAEADTASLSEYGLILTIMLNADFVRSAAAADAPESMRPRSTLRPTIAILRELRPNLPEISVDEPADLVDAYCDAGKNRLPVLKTYIEQSDLRHRYGAASATFEQADGAALASLSAALAPGRKKATPMDEMFVCGSNAKWIERLARLDDRRTYFVAVGAYHLTAVGLEDEPHCNGLQSQLADRGFTVELVPN